MRFLRKNTATRVSVGPFLDKTDGITPEVALTATNEHLTLVVDDAGVPTLVLDAAATASGGSNDLVHITNDNAGYYDLELTAAQTNYSGRAVLGVNYVTDHCPVFHEFMILPEAQYDALFGGSIYSGVVSFGTLDAGDPDTVTLPSGQRTQVRVGHVIIILSGSAAGESRILDAVNTSTGVCTPDTDFDNDPGTAAYIVLTSPPAATASALLPNVSVPALAAAGITSSGITKIAGVNIGEGGTGGNNIGEV